jgi:hypothetical protein
MASRVYFVSKVVEYGLLSQEGVAEAVSIQLVLTLNERCFPSFFLILQLHTRSKSCTMNDQAKRSCLRYPHNRRRIGISFTLGISFNLPFIFVPIY